MSDTRARDSESSTPYDEPVREPDRDRVRRVLEHREARRQLAREHARVLGRLHELDLAPLGARDEVHGLQREHGRDPREQRVAVMATAPSKRAQARNEKVLQELVSSVPGNNLCADCSARNPGKFLSPDVKRCRNDSNHRVGRPQGRHTCGLPLRHPDPLVGLVLTRALSVAWASWSVCAPFQVLRKMG